MHVKHITIAQKCRASGQFSSLIPWLSCPVFNLSLSLSVVLPLQPLCSRHCVWCWPWRGKRLCMASYSMWSQPSYWLSSPSSVVSSSGDSPKTMNPSTSRSELVSILFNCLPVNYNVTLFSVAPSPYFQLAVGILCCKWSLWWTLWIDRYFFFIPKESKDLKVKY